MKGFEIHSLLNSDTRRRVGGDVTKDFKIKSACVSFAMDKLENGDKIIVFKKYESALAANLAKTKLDAYGIPCFLSNETISAMYALPYMKGMEVSLHIFKNDHTQAEEILASSE